MNRSERAEAGAKSIDGRDLEQVIELLTDRVREKFPDPDEAHARGTYNKLLQNQVAMEWLASADKKKLERIDGLLDDYGAAQQIGKFIKIFIYAMAGMIGTIYTVVKAAPDVLVWLRGIIK